MRNAQWYLELVRSRGERGLELKRVYRNLQNKELFLMAYAKLYANDGALTPGVDPQDTVDEMSLGRIEGIIEDLRAGTYQWKPTRRTYIPKRNGKRRPLGVTSWSNKLLQEVIRMIFTAYYEPQFSDISHGFRPGRGCHTALRDILDKWTGTKWFIEGDIRGCFNEIGHQALLAVIKEKIKDERLIKLLKEMLEAGYMEDWRYHQTYSGVPQGNVLSPNLANIFLNELDTYIETTLIPQYTKGKRRRANPEYNRLCQAIYKAKAQGNHDLYRKLVKERRAMPSKETHDPQYRRLRYCRYADDILLGFIGPKAEAIEIKHKIGSYLASMGLTLSDEKTLITHATTGRARFLGYDVYMAHGNSRLCNKRRSINGSPMLSVPPEVVKEWKTRRTRQGKPYHRTELLNNSDYDIVLTYNLEFQGLANYYALAHDVGKKLYPVKWIYLQSLVKTLAAKHKRKATWVYKRYYHKLNNGIKAIVVKVEREGKDPLIARFGAKPIRFDRGAILNDTTLQSRPARNELVRRLLANRCELCDSTENINVHHIRKLKDLKRRFAGRSNPPQWVVRMIEKRRKTLVVCRQCHQAIHAGTYDGPKLN
jgi:group II intron reverse transcriptase/maturase